MVKVAGLFVVSVVSHSAPTLNYSILSNLTPRGKLTEPSPTLAFCRRWETRQGGWECGYILPIKASVLHSVPNGVDRSCHGVNEISL